MPVETTVTEYGYRSAFTGSVSPEEGAAWFEEVKRAIAGRNSFGQFIDLRGQRVQNDATAGDIQQAMSYLLASGLKRSSVVLSSAVAKLQIMRLAKETGMYAYERYFDPSDEQWEAKALAWIVDGTDPDL